jgi:beta-lactamase regulating signal transducer with metallopeptidase domain
MSSWLDGFVDLPPVLTTVFKLTALLGAGWLMHFGLYRCNPRWRVLLWRGVFTGLVLLPLAGFVMPEIPVEVPDVLAPPSEDAIESARHDPKGETLPGRLAHHSMALLLVGWGAGVLFMGARALSTIWRVRRIIGNSQPAPKQACYAFAQVADEQGLRSRVELRVGWVLSSPFLACPIHSGRRHPVIVVPWRMAGETYRYELPAILVHELVHLKSDDSMWAAIGKGLAILGWPHPLTWRMCAAHMMACEQVCDAMAAEYTDGTAEYTRILAREALEVAGVAQVAGGLPMMLRSAKITRRLRHLKRGIPSAALARPWAMLVLLLGAEFSAGLGGVKLVRSEHEALGPEIWPPGPSGHNERKADEDWLTEAINEANRNPWWSLYRDIKNGL